MLPSDLNFPVVCFYLGRVMCACVDKVEIKPNQVRLGEHCDYGTITLVFQLDSEGLQVGFMCSL